LVGLRIKQKPATALAIAGFEKSLVKFVLHFHSHDASRTRHMLPASQTIADRDLRLNLFIERRVHFYQAIKLQSGGFVNGNFRAFSLLCAGQMVLNSINSHE